MKTKKQSAYICENCQTRHIRWAGKCSACSTWNCIVELGQPERNKIPIHAPPVLLSELPVKQEARLSSGIKDMDQVLGGGIVSDSLILLAGEPGVGKSTLMLEMTRHNSFPSYYFSGEESVQQVARRAERMGIQNNNLFVSRETNLEYICSCIREKRPKISIVDSIQTVYQPDRPGTSGNSGQLREAAILLLETARESGCSIFVTGHITKDGSVAGPRLLEHMVDAVLYFDSDRTNHYRLLRAVKNRFGPVGETAVFEMLPKGIKAVSALPMLLMRDDIPGAVHSIILGGSRSLPVEVQALVTRSAGPPKRMTEGLDGRRLILLAAVLEKYLKELNLAECDIFANIVGGFSSDEPALDLAQCTAIVSSCLEISISPYTACLGEVGLAGEIRPVERLSLRIRELQNIGFKTVFVPKDNILEEKPAGIQIRFLRHIRELLTAMQSDKPI